MIFHFIYIIKHTLIFFFLRNNDFLFFLKEGTMIFLQVIVGKLLINLSDQHKCPDQVHGRRFAQFSSAKKKKEEEEKNRKRFAQQHMRCCFKQHKTNPIDPIKTSSNQTLKKRQESHKCGFWIYLPNCKCCQLQLHTK